MRRCISTKLARNAKLLAERHGAAPAKGHSRGVPPSGSYSNSSSYIYSSGLQDKKVDLRLRRFKDLV